MEERLIHRIVTMLGFNQTLEEIRTTIMEDKIPPTEEEFYLAYQAAKLLRGVQ